jgi:hypothetical protein
VVGSEWWEVGGERGEEGGERVEMIVGRGRENEARD